MNDPQKHHTKSKKQDTEGYRVYNSIYIQYPSSLIPQKQNSLSVQEAKGKGIKKQFGEHAASFWGKGHVNPII